MGLRIKELLGRLTGGQAPADQQKSGLVQLPAESPVVQYVNWLVGTLPGKSSGLTLRASQGLPVPPGIEAPLPAFGQVINRLKVQAGLDPIPYPRTKKGVFTHPIKGATWRVQTVFEDQGTEQTCKMDLLGQEP